MATARRKIIVDPNVCNGRPTIEGTRITAQTVLEFLSAGDSVEDDIAADAPRRRTWESWDMEKSDATFSGLWER